MPRWRAAMLAARAHWADRQARNGYYLMLNSVVGAAAGLVFWLALVRLYAIPTPEVGVGVAVIAAGTAVALVAKGGLDAALVRHVPRVSRAEGLGLLSLAFAVGLGAVAACTLALGAASAAGLLPLPAPGPAGLALVALLAALLVVNWLEDAHFLGEGDARWSLYRNLVLHGGRLAAPALVLALALPYPIPVAWAAALAASAGLAVLFLPRVPDLRPRAGAPGPAQQLAAAARPGAVRGAFLRTAGRNFAAGGAEFLPGMLLPPLVLALEGPVPAAHFGIAWAGASALFLASGAIARSAFAELSRGAGTSRCLRRAVRQHALVVAPAAAAALLLGPWLLGLFGPDYAAGGGAAFALLAASVALVAPVYLWLALLRAREDRRGLVAVPLALMLLLLALAPPLEARLGIAGVAVAWIVAHAPLAALSLARLRRALRAQEVTHAPGPDTDPAASLGGAPHLE